MNSKFLLLLPAALLAGAPEAHAYVGLRFNFGVPIFGIPLYTPEPVYTRVSYATQPGATSEVITPAPGPGYVWISGHWSNRNQQWVWLAGRWELPPSTSAVWTDGHWVQGSSGWVWVDAGWTVSTPPTPPAAPPAPPQPPSAGVPAPGSPAPAVSAPAVSATTIPAQGPEMADGTVVYTDPPAPIVEYAPVNPYPGYVWIDGFWGWNGGWYWNAGHYGRPPFRGAAWVSGGWARGARGWAWHGGRWR